MYNNSRLSYYQVGKFGTCGNTACVAPALAPALAVYPQEKYSELYFHI